MEKLLSLVIDSIPKNATPKIIVLFFLFASFLYALSQANIIYGFIDKFNKRELSRLKQLLADENISEKAKITLRDKLNLIAYQKITGIKINNIYLQEQVIHYYKLAKGRFRYSDFKIAASFLRINTNDILEIRRPYWYEKIAHIYWTVLSILLFTILSFFITIFVYFSMSIRLKIAFSILIIGLGAMLFIFVYQISLLPTAKRIRYEIENNPFIIQRNKEIIEMRQANLIDKQFKLNQIPITNEDIDRVVEYYRQQKKLLPIGLAKGKFIVPDDFNDPLPDEILDLFNNPQ